MGGSTPKGEARGECASVLPERDQDANETLAHQSKAFRGNKTKTKTVFRRAHWKETPGSTARSLALSKRSIMALNSRSVSAGGIRWLSSAAQRSYSCRYYYPPGTTAQLQ